MREMEQMSVAIERGKGKGFGMVVLPGMEAGGALWCCGC
jgi:hypothetical protein